MSSSYKEILEGQTVLRAAPGPRHELICGRLHAIIHASVANLSSTQLLAPRTQVKLSSGTTVCPDLALVARATGKLWLAVEVVNSEDHQPDTVMKKQIYEEVRLPRLWMVDPRYDNVETYHGSEYGLMLKGILAGREELVEKLIPEFHVVVRDLFAG
ncbi:MAG TPA: Uma2 family endonuclease [Verrucomicrobiae bacterium]|nr:Uma2 family endonuclease [Verrucomicrobiae bacterium]